MERNGRVLLRRGWQDGKRIAEHIGDINGYGSYILRGIDEDFLVVAHP